MSLLTSTHPVHDPPQGFSSASGAKLYCYNASCYIPALFIGSPAEELLQEACWLQLLNNLPSVLNNAAGILNPEHHQGTAKGRL